MTQAAETVAASVTAGDSLQEWCYVNASAPNPTAADAGITAIRVLSSSGTTPATTGVRAPLPMPMRHGG